ncbi:MAG: hypothetical protein QNI90_18280 [Dinoroseobacter sp.]|nr:hypothetical protein [Dinoroseobacter sp.]MDJ0995532.1 hypothetical protein [Dinoroseobacter sp.]
MRFPSKYGLAAVALFALSATSAKGDVTASVVRQLSQQGYEIQSVQRTLLGRTRVISTQGELRRETVFDPRSGTIMRDIARRGGAGGLAGLLGPLGAEDDSGDDRGTGSRAASGGSGASSSSSYNDDDGDDDSDDSGDDSDDGDDDGDDDED